MGSDFSIFSPNTCNFHSFPSFFFIVAIPVDATWHFFVVLICISLMITADKNIFMCLFAIHVFFWSILLPIFMPVSYSLDYCRFVVNFEIWKCESSSFCNIVLFKKPPAIPCEFKHQLFHIWKKKKKL